MLSASRERCEKVLVIEIANFEICKEEIMLKMLKISFGFRNFVYRKIIVLLTEMMRQFKYIKLEFSLEKYNNR